MELRWEKGHLQASYYRTESEKGKTIMEDRKDTESCLRVGQLHVLTEGPREKGFLGLSS